MSGRLAPVRRIGRATLPRKPCATPRGPRPAGFFEPGLNNPPVYKITLTDADGTRRRPPADDARVAVDREFVDVVRGLRSATAVPYAEALRTHRVACALARSAETGGPVPVSPG